MSRSIGTSLRLYAKLCVSAHSCMFPCGVGGGGSLALSVGSVNPRKGNHTAPLGPQVSVMSCCLWGSGLCGHLPLPAAPQTSPGSHCDPLRSGRCAHPARSGSASSPHPSPGRPCCSRSACGGGAQLCPGHACLDPALTPSRHRSGLPSPGGAPDTAAPAPAAGVPLLRLSTPPNCDVLDIYKSFVYTVESA